MSRARVVIGGLLLVFSLAVAGCTDSGEGEPTPAPVDGPSAVDTEGSRPVKPTPSTPTSETPAPSASSTTPAGSPPTLTQQQFLDLAVSQLQGAQDELLKIYQQGGLGPNETAPSLEPYLSGMALESYLQAARSFKEGGYSWVSGEVKIWDAKLGGDGPDGTFVMACGDASSLVWAGPDGRTFPGNTIRFTGSYRFDGSVLKQFRDDDIEDPTCVQ